jgi:hypothetical protein
MATRDPRPEDLTTSWPTGQIVPLREPEAIPAWAAQQMCNNAAWAGRWAGCADVLSWLLKRYEDDPDVAHALAEYRKLNEQWNNLLVVVASEGKEGRDA